MLLLVIGASNINDIQVSLKGELFLVVGSRLVLFVITVICIW
jgi:hypothetical protein